MILFPNAKINLGLNVISKRPDGFHNIESIFVPVHLSDILEFIESPDGQFVFENTGIQAGGLENNLCVKAYHLLKKKYNLPPLHIHLNKIIPVGAGLGGGSSDATMMLKGLNEYFKLDLSEHELLNMAAELGSDCPFFFFNHPMFIEGRGEKLSPIEISLKGMWLAIIYPEIFVSTSEAYMEIYPEKWEPGLKQIIRKPVNQWKEIMKNDFEEGVFRKYPIIKKIKEELYSKGAIYASMSGSGSSVYGIFDGKPNVEAMKKQFFTWIGELLN